MTQAYVNGFFTKCAQAGVPYDLAVRMIKAADNQTTPPASATANPNPITSGAISPALLKFLNRRPGIAERVNPAHRGWR